MKIAVVGSRNFPSKKFVQDTVFMYLHDCGFKCEFVSGGARGVDTWAEEVAHSCNMGAGIPCKIFKADWDKHGKSAGFMRNEKIINEADLVLAFWDGTSNGTKHSIDLARKNKKPINIYVRVE